MKHLYIYENNIKTRIASCSICSDIYNEYISLDIKQIAYLCKIEEIENFKYLRILDSDYIYGIPYDYNYILKDPIETQKVNLAKCNVSKPSNSLTTFKINGIKCMKNKGILTFIGTINGKIKENKYFKILLSSLHKCYSFCYIPTASSGNKVNIECVLCDNIIKKSSFIFDPPILRNKEDEILFIDESNTEGMECQTMSTNLNLTFGDINSFKFENRKIKFNFIGLTKQYISKNYNFALYLYLISKDIKEPNLSVATCTNNAETKLSQDSYQVNFTCEIIVENEKKYSSFELSQYYNYNIKGFPEDRITFDFPLIFNPKIIKSDNCHKLKEFTINGNFTGSVNNKINFTMEGTFQIKYNLNCSLYNNSEGKAEIHCAINHRINPPELFFEEQEIRKGKDQFNISKIDFIDITCINKTIQMNMINIEVIR